MKIATVRTIPLGGATHDHGWPGGTDPNVQYNTLVEVVSEDGVVGIGSCYTTRALVEGSLQLLKEHLLGESALEPERVSEPSTSSRVVYALPRPVSPSSLTTSISVLYCTFGSVPPGQP